MEATELDFHIHSANYALNIFYLYIYIESRMYKHSFVLGHPIQTEVKGTIHQILAASTFLNLTESKA